MFKIQLDAEALASLFPEGSEARVELRRCVVASLVEKIAVKDLKHLDDQLTRQASSFVKSEIERYAATDMYGNVMLSDKVKGAVLKCVSEAFHQEIHQSTKDIWDDKSKILKDSIDKAIAFHTGVNVKEVAKKAVREVLSEGIR